MLPGARSWRCSATPTFPMPSTAGKVFLFNPGSCGRCYTGPDTYGLLTLENGKVTAYEHKEVPKQ